MPHSVRGRQGRREGGNGGGIHAKVKRSRDGGVSVLGREDVVGALVDLSTEGGEGLNRDGSFDGHVEGVGDVGALQVLGGAIFRLVGHEVGHLNLDELDLKVAEVYLGDVLHLVHMLGGLLHEKSHCYDIGFFSLEIG